MDLISENLEIKLNYFFLGFGLLLLLCLFFPTPIIFLDQHLNFGEMTWNIFEYLLFGIIIVYLMALVFTLIRSVAIRKFINGFMDFGYNVTLSTALLIGLLLVSFTLKVVFAFGLPLFEQNGDLGFIVAFLGIYHITSSVRRLKELGELEL